MKTEIESLNSTEIWDLVAKEKGETLLLADGCTKSNMTRREISISFKKMRELNIRIPLLPQTNLKLFLKFLNQMHINAA